MTPIRDEAIVLREWDFSETSQTVALLTRHHGALRGLAKGARRDNAGFSGGFEPITRGEIAAFPKQSSDLATLAEWDLREVFWNARATYRAHLAALYLVDATRHAITDSQPHPRAFDALLHALRTLEPADPMPAVARFLYDLLVDIGFRPVTDHDAQTNDPLPTRGPLGFDPVAGGLTTDPGPHSSPDPPQNAPVWRVRRATAGALARLATPTATQAEAPSETPRLAHLLATFLAHIVGRKPTTHDSLFPTRNA